MLIHGASLIHTQTLQVRNGSVDSTGCEHQIKYDFISVSRSDALLSVFRPGSLYTSMLLCQSEMLIGGTIRSAKDQNEVQLKLDVNTNIFL